MYTERYRDRSIDRCTQIYIYTYIHIHTYLHVHIYIYIERERDIKGLIEHVGEKHNAQMIYTRKIGGDE